MKIQISILGSTGSIGKTTLKILSIKKNSFILNTLVAHKNYKQIVSQIKIFKPKNFIITDQNIYKKVLKKFKNKKIKIYQNYNFLKKIRKKEDITISAIPGIAGLEPTIEYIKKSKKILVANKESIICGWEVIKVLAKKNKTQIISVDSEHFSINKLILDHGVDEIDKIYITASGGPFLNLPIHKFKNIKPSDAIKHPKWSMGKKISIDSATLMNKVLELYEAYKLFKIDPIKYSIVIHPQSLVHAIVKFKNGLTKLLYHEPSMIVPIANAIFDSKIVIEDFIKDKPQKKLIKNLEFKAVEKKRYPVVGLIPKLNKYVSSPIIINAANEILIDEFLKKKISFNSISKYLFLVLKDKNYRKYAIKRPINLDIIYMIDTWSRKTMLKIICRNK
jgi:1-deoxy-D-xylulose-5-phosphate reductoisomerase